MLSRTGRQIIHVLLTRPPLWGPEGPYRSTCMLKTRRQRSFWARIKLSVIWNTGTSSRFISSLLQFILSYSHEPAYYFISSLIYRSDFELTEASGFRFFLSLSNRLCLSKNLRASQRAFKTLTLSGVSCQLLSGLFFHPSAASGGQRERNLLLFILSCKGFWHKNIKIFWTNL